MPSILYRLAEALLPDYEVEREIASGGMGSVFEARDVGLDRRVAVKIIRPELSTAEAAERFVREAKTLAQVSHPNIVPVHKAGEAAGFFYYIMDYMEGETLATRLKRGPLNANEARVLGRDLLHAVEAVHSLGIVHRDIKPANIFLTGDRALLADFGISRSSGPQTVAQEGGEVVSGTPGYMPPEQAFGWDITERTDLYAVGMVLYEALTGRRWEAILPEKPADWSGVPRRLAPALRRALDFDPRMRWQDARSFRRALWRTRTTKYRRSAALLTLAGLTAGAAAAALLFGGRDAMPGTLVVLPFDVESGMDPQIGIKVAWAAHAALGQLDPVKFPVSRLLWESDIEPSRILRELDAERFVRGRVESTDDALVVRTWVVDSEDNQYDVGGLGTSVERPEEIGCQLGIAIVRAYSPGEWRDFDCWLSGRKSEAVAALRDGDEEAWRQNWRNATDKYREALNHDPTWALAKWRLVNAQRWLRDSLEFNLTDLYREIGDQLSEHDRALLDAWQTPFSRERIRKYEEAVSEYGHDPLTWLAFGDDLQMRGALLGIPLDSAIAIVENAVALDTTLAPAYFNLTWAAMRMGDTAAAAEALERFQALGVGMEPVSPDLIGWVWLERFDSTRAKEIRGDAVEAGNPELQNQWLRFGPAFDVAQPLSEISGGVILGLALDPDADPGDLAHLNVMRGLSLVALGRTHEALTHFDAVADCLGSAEAQLQAAQWRLLPGILGTPPIAEAEVEAARQALGRLADRSQVATRAAWTLALDAYDKDDPSAAQQWIEQVARDTTHESDILAQHLEAAGLARREEYRLALNRSAALIPMSSEDTRPMASGRSGEPFLRTALYLSRAQWRTALGDDRTDGAWLWYENADIEGWPTGTPQAGEIDWAFSTFARFHRGKAALEGGDRDLACPMLHRVLELWTNAEPTYGPLVNEAQRLTDERCPA